MHQIYQSAQIITSTLLFSHIMEVMSKLLSINDALLLTLQDDDLVVVEVIGHLPGSLMLSGCRSPLGKQWGGRTTSQRDPS